MVGESWDVFTKRVLVEKHISGIMYMKTRGARSPLCRRRAYNFVNSVYRVRKDRTLQTILSHHCPLGHKKGALSSSETSQQDVSKNPFLNKKIYRYISIKIK